MVRKAFFRWWSGEHQQDGAGGADTYPSNAFPVHGPSREKVNRKQPTVVSDLQSIYFFFSCSTSPSRGVMYTVVYTSYSTMPGFAPLAFQMFFTSVVSTATFAPVPAL